MVTRQPPSSHFDLLTRLQFLPGVGPARAQNFERLGLTTLEQMVRHYPREWLDASRFVTVRDLRPGELLTVSGEVKHASALRTRGGRGDFAFTVSDGTGVLSCYCFGQSFLARTLTPGVKVVVSGEYDALDRRMLNPMFEVVEGEFEQLLHAGRLIPVHALTKGVTARGMRTAMRHALDAVADLVPDPLPASIAAPRGLEPLGDALRAIHFPESAEALAAARRRLAFEELFLLQMVMELRRRVLAEEGRALALASAGALADRVRAALPFTLTEDQRRVGEEIAADMALPRPMHRLVIGDVGSGKTVVALIAAAQAIETGHQVAFMAPTEVLARQHAASLTRFASEAGIEVASLTGTTSAAHRRLLQARLAAGEPLLVVGTHALLEDKVSMPRLALVIVDEQHRFGVRQRATLAQKGVLPHVLVLTATPIPRTLQLAFFGDLDLSVIRSRPAGRGRLVTRVTGEEKFHQVVDFMAKELAGGRQAFVVVPAIEESGRSEMKAAETEVERLRQQPLLKPYRIGLLHGKLKGDEKQSVMAAFKSGELHVLVATTVIEVGIDIPNATLMVVQDAERFGLTQLHQLRGRVGRGEHRSVCVFIGGNHITARGRERLQVMATTDDGFELAEADLRLRGPGEMWGTRQSGLPRLKMADLYRDEALLAEAQLAAHEVVAMDALLMRPEHAALKRMLLHHYREPLELALAG